MPPPLMDGQIEYTDGTPATASQVIAKFVATGTDIEYSKPRSNTASCTPKLVRWHLLETFVVRPRKQALTYSVKLQGPSSAYIAVSHLYIVGRLYRKVFNANSARRFWTPSL